MQKIKVQCYDCGAKEELKNEMRGKRCSKCNGRLIPCVHNSKKRRSIIAKKVCKRGGIQ